MKTHYDLVDTSKNFSNSRLDFGMTLAWQLAN
jgi:hypothetical protein